MNGELEIEGRVISVNIADFLQPIFIILKNQIIRKEKLTGVLINLRYINSSGKRTIIELFKLIKILGEENLLGHIVWKHEKDDDFIREFGEDVEEISGLNFQFIEVK